MSVDSNTIGLADVPGPVREDANLAPTFTTSVDRKGLTQIENEAQQSIREHRRAMFGDGIWYNGGTGLILLATSFATFAPNLVTKDYSWIVQALTALATFLVAL